MTTSGERVGSDVDVGVTRVSRLMQEADEARIDQALEAASRRIDLDGIATGPADEIGIGPGTEPYQLLDMVERG